ncbi:MAG: VWA domain-containing protein [Cyclobacteriaceae bacterium]
MVRCLVLTLLLVPLLTNAQITATQQKALNSYIEYLNKSGEEAQASFMLIRDYYDNLQRYRTSKYKQPIRFTYTFQPEDYFYNTALGRKVGTDDILLKAKLDAVRKAAEAIDLQLKSLDTYHKLEDYKTDDYKKAEDIISKTIGLFADYRSKRNELYNAVRATYTKLQSVKAGAYANALRQMQDRIAHETSLLDLWSYNLNAKTHSGWPVEALKAHILESQEFVEKKIVATGIQYPASSMIPSFEEGLVMLQQTKRNGLDGYTYEAQKSDEHSNGVYLELINLYNGVLISFYNTFVGYASNNYAGLLAITYVPAFDIRTNGKEITNDIQAFQDIPHATLSVKPQTGAVPQATFKALSNYIDYINECVRQTDHLQRLYANLWGSTPGYRDLTSFKGKGGLTFELRDFEIPVSYLQKAVAESKSIPEAYRKSLNEQAEVLNRILIEMNQLSVALDRETDEKNYERDNLKQLDELIARFKAIWDIFHIKKEVLYVDTRSVFESYKASNPANSWNVSAKALLQLADADKAELLKANLFYTGDQSQKPDPDKIQTLVRTVISDEYTNLKGIEKLGRFNGNCPYTPYEDLANDSKKFIDPEFKASTLSPLSYSHPYHTYVYMFNNVARNYNKFCELSPVPLLQTIYEPELFILDRGNTKNSASGSPTQANDTQDNSPLKAAQRQPEGPVTTDAKNTNIRDTVYIEKHDTVWLDHNPDLSRNMEGYATNNLVLLLDVSGSMSRSDKLPLLKQSVLQLLDMMREEDELALVVFSGKPKVLLEPVSFKDQTKIRKAISKLQSKGTTDGNAALALAYEVADENYIRAGNNRIVLATDGEFPISTETEALIKKFAKADIYLTVFNFGGGAGSGKALEKLASTGSGNYAFVTKENVDQQLIREVKSKRKR